MRYITTVIIFFTFSISIECQSQFSFRNHQDLYSLVKREDYEGLVKYMNYLGFELVEKSFGIRTGEEIINAELTFKRDNKFEPHKGIYYPFDKVIVIAKEDEKDIYFGIIFQVYTESRKFYLIDEFLSDIEGIGWTYYKLYDIEDRMEVNESYGKWDDVINLEAGTRNPNPESRSLFVNGIISILMDSQSPEYNVLRLSDFSKSARKADSTSLFLASELGDNRVYFSIFNCVRNSRGSYLTFDYIFKTIFSNSKSIVNGRTKIISVPYIKKGKLNYVYITIGGIKVLYIIDTGASDMSLPESVFSQLISQGVLNNSHILPKARYKLADGSIIERSRMLVPVMSVGSQKVENVVVTLVADNEPLLLGKSFLDKFKSFKVDSKLGILELETF